MPGAERSSADPAARLSRWRSVLERIREEVNVGRPLGSAIRKGFSNALSAIVDSNVTTIIAAVVLYAFGTGSVRGFALTLGIGVVTSLFTAVFITHKLLDVFADLGIKNQKLYVRYGEEE